MLERQALQPVNRQVRRRDLPRGIRVLQYHSVEDTEKSNSLSGQSCVGDAKRAQIWRTNGACDSIGPHDGYTADVALRGWLTPTARPPATASVSPV